MYCCIIDIFFVLKKIMKKINVLRKSKCCFSLNMMRNILLKYILCIFEFKKILFKRKYDYFLINYKCIDYI